jgi:hypothetical protein
MREKLVTNGSGYIINSDQRKQRGDTMKRDEIEIMVRGLVGAMLPAVLSTNTQLETTQGSNDDYVGVSTGAYIEAKGDFEKAEEIQRKMDRVATNRRNDNYAQSPSLNTFIASESDDDLPLPYGTEQHFAARRA